LASDALRALYAAQVLLVPYGDAGYVALDLTDPKNHK
jgi:hypothetical protein